MKLSEETRKKHRWLLKELRGISKELEEMEEAYKGKPKEEQGVEECRSLDV